MARDALLNILVIEDDADTQANIRDILALDDYRATPARTCAEALDRENWEDISAILLDRKLPDGYAEKLLPSLHQLAPKAPVVVVTGLPDIQGAIDALRAGAYDYILKPINPDSLRATLRRIVEHLRVQQAFRESEERMRVVLETAADAIITIDRRGLITGANPSTERMFGYALTEIVGKNVSILMPAPYCDEHDTYIERYLNTGEARIIGIGRDVTGRRKDGSNFPVSLSVSEVPDLGLFTGIIRDISAVKELQKQVLEIAAEQDRRIGHELHDNTQQQLTGLGLLAQSLAENLGQQGAPQAEIAHRLARGIKEATNHVHLLSRGLVPVEIDAEGLRSALSEFASRVSDQYGILCDFRYDGAVDIADNFVATHLYRITQEAITNAIKHGRADRIELSLKGNDQTITLSILDNGSGIGDKREIGSGMGLRLMHYRAGLIGATILIEPGERQGTMVSCTVSRRA